jgi:hypothetical protein
MLQRGSGPVTTFAFLTAVEIEDGGSTSPEQVMARLQEGLTFMEGVGAVECENLGKLDMYDSSADTE